MLYAIGEIVLVVIRNSHCTFPINNLEFRAVLIVNKKNRIPEQTLCWSWKRIWKTSQGLLLDINKKLILGINRSWSARRRIIWIFLMTDAYQDMPSKRFNGIGWLDSHRKQLALDVIWYFKRFIYLSQRRVHLMKWFQTGKIEDYTIRSESSNFNFRYIIPLDDGFKFFPVIFDYIENVSARIWIVSAFIWNKH